MKSVAIAGTWRAQEGDDIYEFAEGAAAVFASRGWSVITGGYTGVMDAGLKGASQNGAMAYALTWSKLDGVLPISQFAKQQTKYSSIAKRAGALIGDADAVLVMPGRTGTVAELALAVEARAKGDLSLPVLVYQRYWDSFFAWLGKSNAALMLSADETTTDDPPLFQRVFSLSDVEAILNGERR